MLCFIDFLHFETVEYEPPDSDSDEVEEEEEEDEEDDSMWQEDALVHTNYGRFARCPVRPESFRPVVSPGVWSRFARTKSPHFHLCL